jgi:hypothetical protein
MSSKLLVHVYSEFSTLSAQQQPLFLQYKFINIHMYLKFINTHIHACVHVFTTADLCVYMYKCLTATVFLSGGPKLLDWLCLGCWPSERPFIYK